VQVETSKSEQVKEGDAKDESEGEEEDTEQEDNEEEAKPSSREFLTFFYTNETGIKHQDKFVLRTSTLDIFALKVPHFYAVERSKEDYLIKRTTLHDFQRINHDDEIIKNSILNFSFHLTSGNLD
jgi:intraflagellar transport protein 140